MINGPDPEIVLETSEHRFELRQQPVKFPQILRLLVAQVTSKAIVTVVKLSVFEFLFVQFEPGCREI